MILALSHLSPGSKVLGYLFRLFLEIFEIVLDKAALYTILLYWTIGIW